MIKQIPFDIKYGIYIDQTDFIKLAQSLGYNKYYEQYPNKLRNYFSINKKMLGRTGNFQRVRDNDSV